MKRILATTMAVLTLPVTAFAAGVSTTGSTQQIMKPALIILTLILAALVLSCIIFTVLNAKATKVSGTKKLMMVTLYLATIIVLICTLLCYSRYQTANTGDIGSTTTAPTTETTEPTTEETTEATTVPPTEPEPTFDPTVTELSNPANWKVKWEIIEHGSIVNTFQRNEAITFGDASEYSQVEGVISFRGDNYRSGPTYGTADVVNKTLATKWSKQIGSYNRWSGSGWTGQPLIVRWDEETKAIMNLYEEKKAKKDLVEVIYATLDGYIYFYDLEDGSYTRDKMWVGMNFKGAGSLDPRGYPLMYVGSGDKVDSKKPRMYVISLIDTTILYEKSGADSFTKRSWYAFDSAPLLHKDSDTLIWPGESGILYTIKLNTNYNKAAGTISVAPEEVVKTRYTTGQSRTYGYEASCIIVGQYLYLGDNGGMFFCVDLNTMELIWTQDTKDDINATPVFEWGEDGKGYIYVGTSTEHSKDKAYIYKLDAATGEIVWTKVYEGIAYNESVSGGILSSPLLGKAGTALEGMVIFSIGRTPKAGSGTLVALNTDTGEVIWEQTLSNYCWSSPAPIYTDSGDAYILQCDSAGNARLIDVQTGETISTVKLGSNVEASPAIFENTAVVGTRGGLVWGISIG